MKFCTKCGATLEGTSQCQSCGEMLQSNEQKMQTNAPSIKEVSLKNNVLLSVLLALLLLSFIGYKIGNTVYSKENAILNFQKAIVSKNVKEIASYISSSDPRLQVNEQTVKHFLQYIDEDPSCLTNLVSTLNQQAKNTDTIQNEQTKEAFNENQNETNSGILQLKQKGKKYLLFKNYTFEVQPFFLSLSTNFQDTKFMIDDKEIGIADQEDFSKQYGPFMPGIYQVKAILKTPYDTIQREEKIHLISSEYDKNNSIYSQDLSLNAFYLEIHSDYEDANLFANGKDTGILVQDATHFGPVGENSNLELSTQKEFPWGNVEGEKIKFDGSTNIYLPLAGVNEVVKEDIMKTINEYNMQWVHAITTRDSSKIKNVSQNKINELNDQIKQMIEYDRYFKGKLDKIQYDLDSFRIYKDASSFVAEVNNKEQYTGDWYYEGDTNIELSTENPHWTYKLIYDAEMKKWLVDYVSSSYDFNESNIKEFTF